MGAVANNPTNKTEQIEDEARSEYEDGAVFSVKTKNQIHGAAAEAARNRKLSRSYDESPLSSPDDVGTGNDSQEEPSVAMLKATTLDDVMMENDLAKGMEEDLSGLDTLDAPTEQSPRRALRTSERPGKKTRDIAIEKKSKVKREDLSKRKGSGHDPSRQTNRIAGLVNSNGVSYPPEFDDATRVGAKKRIQELRAEIGELEQAAKEAPFLEKKERQERADRIEEQIKENESQIRKLETNENSVEKAKEKVTAAAARESVDDAIREAKKEGQTPETQAKIEKALEKRATSLREKVLLKEKKLLLTDKRELERKIGKLRKDKDELLNELKKAQIETTKNPEGEGVREKAPSWLKKVRSYTIATGKNLLTNPALTMQVVAGDTINARSRIGRHLNKKLLQHAKSPKRWEAIAAIGTGLVLAGYLYKTNQDTGDALGIREAMETIDMESSTEQVSADVGTSQAAETAPTTTPETSESVAESLAGQDDPSEQVSSQERVNSEKKQDRLEPTPEESGLPDDGLPNESFVALNKIPDNYKVVYGDELFNVMERMSADIPVMSELSEAKKELYQQQYYDSLSPEQQSAILESRNLHSIQPGDVFDAKTMFEGMFNEPYVKDGAVFDSYMDYVADKEGISHASVETPERVQVEENEGLFDTVDQEQESRTSEAESAMRDIEDLLSGTETIREPDFESGSDEDTIPTGMSPIPMWTDSLSPSSETMWNRLEASPLMTDQSRENMRSILQENFENGYVSAEQIGKIIDHLTVLENATNYRNVSLTAAMEDGVILPGEFRLTYEVTEGGRNFEDTVRISSFAGDQIELSGQSRELMSSIPFVADSQSVADATTSFETAANAPQSKGFFRTLLGIFGLSKNV